MSKKVMISGPLGNLGQYLVKFFQDNHPDFKIIGLRHNIGTYKNKTIFDLSKIIFEPYSLFAPLKIQYLIDKYKPDYFINTAGLTSVIESTENPVDALEDNTFSILYQLEAIRLYSPKTKYLNCGSSLEFNNQSQNIYGLSKCCSRMIIQSYRRFYDLYCLQSYLHNCESFLRSDDYVSRKITKGVARINKCIESGQVFEPILLGNLSSKRQFGATSDFAEAIWIMLNQEDYRQNEDIIHSGQLKDYIISSNEAHSIKEFVEEALEQINIKGTWKTFIGGECYLSNEEWPRPLVKTNSQFYREEYNISNDNLPLIQELGWKPKISFKELVKNMVENDLNEFRRS